MPPSKKTPSPAWHNPKYATFMGWFLFAYFLTVIGGRYTMRGSVAFYDAAWACNAGLLLTSLGAIFRHADLVGTGIVIALSPHLLWIIDVLGWLALGKFYLGSAQFLIWPQTTWITIATTLHHVWFLPVSIYLLKGNGGVKPITYWYGVLSYYVLMVIGRFMIPKSVILDDGSEYELNINLGHAAYKSVRIEFLHWYDDAPFPVYFTFAVFIGMGVVTTVPFLALRAFSRRYLEDDSSKAKAA